MTRLLAGTALSALLTGVSFAAEARPYDIPQQDAATALQAFAMQSGKQVLFPYEAVKGKQAPQIKGDYSDAEVIALLAGSAGLRVTADDGRTVTLRPQSAAAEGEGGADAGTVQALVVTAQKREENIQDVPIAMSAFTQEDLTKSQVAGGPDLMTQVPNFTFTKTNFSGYSIQIRGIGTQAISATTDAAVAVAENNTPFIRNRFFEQEFYDLERVEVLRGPQGTLYGRNATAGVVNIITAKPKFSYDARLSADLGNYNSTRFEGMLNIPLVDDKVALRIAGAWTKRDGYTTNQLTGNQIDGRDLWSTRVTLRVDPAENLKANLVWEHFEENDDRLRSGKQLCHMDDRAEIDGYHVNIFPHQYNVLSQGCIPASLYAPESFEAPNGFSLPYYYPLGSLNVPLMDDVDPYVSTVQSRDLRTIESTLDPKYRAQTDVAQIQLNATIGDLTLTSETAYASDEIFSMEDYNRFSTRAGIFDQASYDAINDGPFVYAANLLNNGFFCDPQLGCSNRLLAADVSTARSRQLSQEFRVASDYEGSFNFNVGANFLRYDTLEKYYVFVNTMTMAAALTGGTALPPAYVPGVSDNQYCLDHGLSPPNPRLFQGVGFCTYMDPNPIDRLNDLGHNYFLSKNPYKLISYAVFGEIYYQVLPELKLTAGLRWTVDKKEAPRIPSWVLGSLNVGYPVLEVMRQEWREPSGRLSVDWKPELSFTDQSLLYASYSHGYKAGGANPPPSGVVMWAVTEGEGSNSIVAQAALDRSATHPKTFDPEFVNAYEIGSKNTLIDGSVMLNADAFYYDYTGYQISQIADRSAINYNFDAKIWGAEVEASWRPLENLRIGFKGGYENTRVADGMKAVDTMDRTAGQPGWAVVRAFPTLPSNCVVPTWLMLDGMGGITPPNQWKNGNPGWCEILYSMHLDPWTLLPYEPDPTHRKTWVHGQAEPFDWAAQGYHGFDPASAPNNGEGFYKDLSGNELPNAPHFTATVTADYTLPLPNDWLMTLHSDFYYQSEAWARIFNTPGYDKLKAYTNVNLAAIFSNEDAGWKVMAYVKNVFDHDAITGAFLNSDDTGLTTNVFLNEPRLYGLRVTKEWTGGAWWTGANPNHTGHYPLAVEIGGAVQRHNASASSLAPDFAAPFSPTLDPTIPQHRDLDWGDGREVTLTYSPGGKWSISAGFRYGKANGATALRHGSEALPGVCLAPTTGPFAAWGREMCDPTYVMNWYGMEFDLYSPELTRHPIDWSDASATLREEHSIVDFDVHRDVGLGFFSSASLAFGLRYGNFDSHIDTTLRGIPDFDVPDGFALYPATHHMYDSALRADRGFIGAGPTLALSGSNTIWHGQAGSHADLDWNLTGGALFGKQKTSVVGVNKQAYFSRLYTDESGMTDVLTPSPVDIHRSKAVTVPVVDLSLGLSYEVERFKVSTGYRWERYFNVLDAGYAEHKSYDRTIDGPYFKIAVGFGG
ncbi:MAG: Lpg1974 family pore-forming outer membrane protein [Ignavibacteriales bacterium]